MNTEEIIKKYKKYLTKAQINGLIEATERTRQLHAGQRADAQAQLNQQYRSARRGLQNTGLASRQGKVISGRESALKSSLERSYGDYNRQLRNVEQAQVEQQAVRMANQTIRARQQQQEEELKKQLEQIQKEEEERRQRLKDELRGGRNGVLTETGGGVDYRLAEIQAQRDAIQKQINAQRKAQNAQYRGMTDTGGGADYRFIEAGYKQERNARNTWNMLRADMSNNWNRAQTDGGDIMRSVSGIYENPVRRFFADNRQGYEAYRNLPSQQQSTINNALRQAYEDIDANVERWNRDIAAANNYNGAAQQQNIPGYEKTTTLSGSFKEDEGREDSYDTYRARNRRPVHPMSQNNPVAYAAEKARRERAAAYSTIYLISAALDKGVDIDLLLDDNFDVRYDAAIRSIESSLKDIKRQKIGDSTGTFAMLENDMLQDYANWETARMLRESLSPDGVYWMTYSNANAGKYLPEGAQKVRGGSSHNALTEYYHVYGNPYMQDGWKPYTYDEEHGTERSKYAAIINDFSRMIDDPAWMYSWGKGTEFGDDLAKLNQAIGNFNFSNMSDTQREAYNKAVRTYSMTKGTMIAGDANNTARKQKVETAIACAYYMTADEIDTYNSILAEQGEQKADEYFEFLLPQLADRLTYQVNRNNEESATAALSDPVEAILTSLASVPVNLYQGVTQPIKTMFAQQNDPTAAKLEAMRSNTAGRFRQAMAAQMGNVGGFIYQTGMSAVDSATVAMISSGIGNLLQGAGMAANAATKAGSVIGGSLLGGSAYNSAYDEALQRGLTPDKARMTALGQGINEMLFESLSIGTLLEKTGHAAIQTGKGAFTDYMVNMLIQAGVEGSEEVFTDIANRIWDNRINGIYSEEIQTIQRYIAEGMSPDEAKKKAFWEYAGQLGLSFLGGAISGGVMAGVGQGINNVKQGYGAFGQNNPYYQSVRDAKHFDRAMRESLDTFEFKNEKAREIQKKGKKSNQDYALLYDTMRAELYDQYKGNVEQAVNDGVISKEDAKLIDKWQQNGVQSVDNDGNVVGNENGITADELAAVTDALEKVDVKPLLDIISADERLQLNKAVGTETAEVIRSAETTEQDAEEKYRQTVREINNDTTLSPELKQKRLEAAKRTRQYALNEASKTADTALTNKKGIGAKLETDDNGTVIVGKGSGKVTYDFSTKGNPGHQTVESMTATEQSALRIAKIVAASRPDVNVKVEAEFGVDENGIDHSKENGYYDRSTNTIHINMSGDNSVLWTLSHELTHHLANTDTAAYAALRTAIETALKDSKLTTTELEDRGFEYDLDRVDPYIAREGNLWNALVAFEREEHGYGKDAEEEVVARCCESFLGFDQFVKDFARKQYKSAKAVNKFIAQMNIDMQRVSEEARQSAAQRNVWNDESPENQILRQLTEIDKIANLWRIAVNAEAKKRQTAREETRASTKDSVKLSDTEYLDLARRYESGDKSVEADLRKAVDAAAKRAGYTITAYHGTASQFNVFNRSQAGKHGDNLGPGYYFAADKAFAREYARGSYVPGENTTRIIDAYLKIEKPASTEKLTITKAQWHGFLQYVLDHHTEYIDDAWQGNYTDESIFTFDQDWESENNSYGNDKDLFLSFAHAYAAGNPTVTEAAYRMLKDSTGYDGIIYEPFYKSSEKDNVYVVFTNTQMKQSDLVTHDNDGNIIPLSERFNTKNEDIRYSKMDKVRLTTADGTRTYTSDGVTAKLYGNDVELDGGKVRQRVQMMEAIAEVNGTARVDAASEAEAEAFRRTGAEQVTEELEGHGAKYGTWEFKYEERKFTNDSRYDIKQKQKFAKSILKQVGKSSGFTQAQRVKYGAALGRLMDYLWEMQYGKMDGKIVFDFADRLFDSILNDYTALSEADEEFRSELLANMTKTKNAKGSTVYVLDVNDKQMREIKYAYENAMAYASKLSKALGARVTVKQTENAKTLEDIFTNSTDTRIKSDTNEGDMPGELMRIAQETESRKTNPYAAESEERQALKMGMFEAAMAAAGVEKSTAQQIREAVKETRKTERTKASKEKAELRKKITEAKLIGQMDRGKYREMVRREERERFERKVEKLKEQQYSEDKQVRRDLLKITKSNYDRLVTMLAKPSDGSHVPVQLAREVAEFCLALSDLLDVKVNSKVESLAEANLTKRGVLNVQKLMDAYQQTFADKATIEEALRENPGYDPRGKYLAKELYDESLYKMMEGLKEILNGKTLSQLDNYELRALMMTVRGVLHTVYDANKTTIKGESRATYQQADTMDRQLREAKNVFGRKRNVLTKGMNQYVIEQLGLRRIAKIYSSSNEDAVFVRLVDDLNDGAIEKERIALALRKMFDPVTTKYAKDMKTWYGKNAEWIDTGLKKDGKPVLITKGMRVSLAMHILNEQNLRNLEEKGVTIPNREEYRKGEYNQAYKVGHGMTVRMTKAQAQQIVSQMTEAEKAYFEVAKELFHKRAGYYINRTSLKLLGYAKAIVENYFPIQVDDAYKLVEYDAIAKNAGVEHPGFLETRKGTTSVMYLNDITAVVNRQIDGVAKYAGLAIPMRNWNAVMNQRLYHEDENGNWIADKGRVHDTLENEMGYTATKYNTENGSQRLANVEFVDQFIKDLAGHTQLSANDKGFGGSLATKLTSNYVKAVLLLNARVALSQAASLPTAAAEIPWQYIAKAFKGHIEGHMNHARIDELIDQYTPIFAMRRAGTQNEIADLMKRRGLSDKAEQKLPWLLGWITTMDTLTTRRLWYACEQWTAKETKIPIGSDAFYKEVAKRYERVIQNTQPNFTVLQRSPALRSQSPLTRIVTMFGTQRMQNGGIFMENAFEFAQAQGKEAKIKALRKMGRSMSALVTAAIMLGLERTLVAMARGRVKPLQDDDKEVTAKSVDKYLRDDIISSLSGSFMFGSEIYDLVSGKLGNIFNGDAGYDSNYALPVTEALEAIVKFVKEEDWNFFNYMQGEHTDEERWNKTKSFVNKLMTVTSYLTGLPLQNASKTILNGIVPGWQDIADWKKTGEFNPFLHQSGKLDKKQTNANYKEWTNNGFKGSEYFYWENKLSEYGKRDEKIPILLDADLPNEKKAMLLRMMDKSGATSEGTKVFKANGDLLIDFANPTEKQQALPMPSATESAAPNATPTSTPTPTATPNPLTDARQEGVKEAVAKGVNEQTAFDTFLAYQNMGKNRDESDGYSKNDEFREWLFKNVTKPEDRAILEYQVIGQASKVEGAVTYRESGTVYRDYTNESWYKLSQHSLAKDGTNKRYDAAKKLEQTGLTVDKTVELYDGLKDLTKKAEWKEYLKAHGLTDEQVNIFLWSRGWAKLD